MKHKCPNCFSEISDRRRDAVYCSKACKQAAYRIRLEKSEESVTNKK